MLEVNTRCIFTGIMELVAKKRKNFDILSDIDTTIPERVVTYSVEDETGFQVVGNTVKDVQKRQKKQKKQIQKRLESGLATAEDLYTLFGSQIKPHITYSEGIVSLPCDISLLVLAILLDFGPPKSLAIEHKQLIKKIVMIQLDGLSFFSAACFGLHQLLSTELTASSSFEINDFAGWCKWMSVFNTLYLPTCVNSSMFCMNGVASSLLNVPGFILSNNKKWKSQKNRTKLKSEMEQNSPIIASETACEEQKVQEMQVGITVDFCLMDAVAHDNDKKEPGFLEVEDTDDMFHTPSYYILSATELSTCLFPNEDSGFLTFPLVDEKKQISKRSRLFSIDCEMCQTNFGLELTRVSVVDHNLKCVYDTFVLPPHPITDYLTQYSGVTAELLRGVTIRVSDVFLALSSFITANDILCGHSLENDLMQLRVQHSFIIDTSVIYPHPRGLPYRYSLKSLCTTFLSQSIQEFTHDSVEDARAAMALVLLKIKKGPAFGITLKDDENLLLMLTKNRLGVAMIGYEDLIKRLAPSSVSATICFHDKEVEEKGSKACQSSGSNLIYLQFKSFESLFYPLKKAGDARINAAELTAIGNELNERLKRIESSLPSNTLVIYSTGQPPLFHLKRLQERKLQAQQQGNIWNDESQLLLAQSAVKQGIAWLKIIT